MGGASNGGFVTPVFKSRRSSSFKSNDVIIFKAKTYTSAGIEPCAIISNNTASRYIENGVITILPEPIDAKGISDPTEPGILILVITCDLLEIAVRFGIDASLVSTRAMSVPAARQASDVIVKQCTSYLKQFHIEQYFSLNKTPELRRQHDQDISNMYRLIAPGNNELVWELSISHGAVRQLYSPTNLDLEPVMVYIIRIRDLQITQNEPARWTREMLIRTCENWLT